MGLFKKALGGAALSKYFRKRRSFGQRLLGGFGRRRHRGGFLRKAGFGTLAFLAARRLFARA